MRKIVDILDNEEARDSFYDEISKEFCTLPEDAQDDMFRWICEEMNEIEDREEIVKNLKKKAKDLKKRYGDDWKTVMYKIATSTAMGATPDDRDK